jgi:protein-glutamine gamma-glutamyltransferase
MNSRQQEIETILLTMFAAVPLYFTYAVGIVPLVAFHAVMAAIAFRVASGRGPDLVPLKLMRVLAFAYILFYLVDAVMLSRSAIAASTHLVLFIAAYQPIESLQRNNQAQRLLTISLIFIASLSTSTHLSIVLFVLAFGIFMFRQMFHISHMETMRSLNRPYASAPASRSATFYLFGTALIGALLFPILPRLSNPVVKGFSGPLSNATTGLSDSIDFNESRSSTPDATLVARVWMGREAVPFFTPLRLRGVIYDRYENNAWLQSREGYRDVPDQRGVFHIARPVGFARTAIVQQRLVNSTRLLIPSGTYAISGLPMLMEGPTADSYAVPIRRGDLVNYEASMARSTEPLQSRRVRETGYVVTPEVASMAARITAGRTSIESKANAVEQYLARNYQYYQRPEQIGRRMSTDDFLLRERRGHCEYFAAGMVALLAAQDVRARIAGGFYGGRLNPLTGYFMVRREDAHAWVEVWNGSSWQTFDPTPASLRPGSDASGFLQSYLSALNDSVNYFWDRYVLTFGFGDQVELAVELITRARGALALARGAMKSAGDVALDPRLYLALAGVGAILYLAISFRRRPRVFDLLNRHLRALGFEVGPAMTVEEALTSLREKNPDAARDLEPLIALYEEEEFSARRDPERRRLLHRKLEELRG